MGKYLFTLHLKGILLICVLWIFVEHGLCYMPQYPEFFHRPGLRRFAEAKESTKRIAAHQRTKEGSNRNENNEHKKVTKLPRRPSVAAPSIADRKSGSVGHLRGVKPDPKLLLESGRRGLQSAVYPASKVVQKMNRTVPELAPKKLDDDYDDDDEDYISTLREHPQSRIKTGKTGSNPSLQMRQESTSTTTSTTKKKDTESDEDDTTTTSSTTSTKKKDSDDDTTTTSKASTKKKDTEWDDDDDEHKSTPAWETVKPIPQLTSTATTKVTERTTRNTADWETVETTKSSREQNKTRPDPEEMTTHFTTKPPPPDETTAQDTKSSETGEAGTTTLSGSSTESAQNAANETTPAQETDSGMTSEATNVTVSGVQTKRCGCPVTNATTTTTANALRFLYYNYTTSSLNQSQKIYFRVMQESTSEGPQTKRCGCPITNGTATPIETTKDCSCPSIVPTRPCGCELKPDEQEYYGDDFGEKFEPDSQNIERVTKPKGHRPIPPRLRNLVGGATKECGCPRSTTPGAGECSHKFDRIKGFRDVGATKVEIGDFPYLVEINYKGQHHCVGTLFTLRIVLTAAHCCYKVGTLTRKYIKRPVRFHPGELFVLLGTSERTPGFYETTHERRGIVAVLPHEKYDPWIVSSYDYDLGLLLLTHEVTLSKAIQLVELKLPADPMPTNKTRCTVVGWGVPEEVLQTGCMGVTNNPLDEVNKPVSAHLMKIEMRYLPKCEKEGPQAHMCASWKEKQACMGDSGSPFICSGQQMALVGKACQSHCPGQFYRLDDEWQIQWLVRSAATIETIVSEAFGLTGFSNLFILFITFLIRMF